MKNIHFLLAFICALFFSSSHHAFAQDADNEEATTEEGTEGGGDASAAGGEGGGDAAAAPAAGGDGGGDAAAAPAAGGEAAPAAAPAAGGEAAAAPAAPAPAAAPAAPAPASAPAAPAFDMGSAVQSAAVAAPPAAAIAESNPIVATVVATGGDVSLSDISSIGISNIKKLAANPSSGGSINISNLKRNLVAKVNVVKAFKGDIDDLVEIAGNLDEDSLESFSTLDRSEVVTLAQGKTLTNDATGIAELTKTSTKAKVAKVAKDNGKSMTEQLAIINDYTDDQLDALEDFELEDLDTAFKAGGDDALADPDQLARTAEVVKDAEGDPADLLAKLDSAVVTDINGLPFILKDGNKFVWTENLSGIEIFSIESADNDTDYSDAPEFTRVKFTKNGVARVTDLEETLFTFDELSAARLDYDSEKFGGFEDNYKLISPSVIEFSWTDEEEIDGEIVEISGIALLKLINIDGEPVPIWVEFISDEQSEDYEDSFADSYDAAFLASFEAATTFDDFSDELQEFLQEGKDDYEAGFDKASFVGDAGEAVALWKEYWDDQAEVLLENEDGKPIFVTFQVDTEENEDLDKSVHFHYDLEGTSIAVVNSSFEATTVTDPYYFYTNTVVSVAEEPTVTTYTFGVDTVTWIEDGEEHSASYSVMGEGILRITEDGEDSYMKVYSLNTYNSNADAERNFYVEHFEFEDDLDMDEYENFRYGWHSFYEVTNSNGNGGEIEIIFADEESAVNSEYYQYLVSLWNSSSLNPDNETPIEEEEEEEEEEIIEEEEEIVDEDEEEEIIDDEEEEEIVDDEEEEIIDDEEEEEIVDDEDVTLLQNALAAIEDENDQDTIQDYIDSINTDQVSAAAIQASVEFLEWALTNREILDGDDLSSDEPYTGAGGFKRPEDINWDLPQVQNFLGLLTELHLLGDSDASNQDSVQSFLDNLYSSDELSDLLDDTENDLTSSFGPLVDSLIGDERARIDDAASDREADLDSALGEGISVVDEINIKSLVGHNNDISGTISDDDESIDSVDLTVIASTRDTVISDDLTIVTPDSAKEDAYVIAAADELYLREPWTSAQAHTDSYADPDKLSIEVQNSSLALAAIDEMNLVNVDITTGGSLAIASLDEINIWSTDSMDPNVFKVGADDGNDFEGLFLYAQELIEINGLNVQGRVDDIYMEAYTINLENVTFPSSSAVLMRTELGGLNILNDGGSFGLGDVNLDNVRHLGVKNSALVHADFSTNPSGAHQTILNSSGRPYMKVESYK